MRSKFTVLLIPLLAMLRSSRRVRRLRLRPPQLPRRHHAVPARPVAQGGGVRGHALHSPGADRRPEVSREGDATHARSAQGPPVLQSQGAPHRRRPAICLF
ncbi:hypothetical protein PR003_g3448 [Phytophthora rubi]|uniref:RxLR effector protein n=1 Tax=Phytophthora rubi TaxID=129364 RepID=A0A6A3MPR8_9STRA|nr:hypothetical protein PR001_g10108 [Phytophthora rubi]KAE9354279.1 hypothetical protein PR003_g3448 [Phytophthora rubi]